MFDAERVEDVRKAREAMEKAARALWRLEAETIPSAEADLKKAEGAYQDAAGAAVRDRSARGKLLEAETALDEARRHLDGLRQLAREAKQKGEKLSEEYGQAIRAARLAEAGRLLTAAEGKFAEIAERWNCFAASVRDLVLIKKALSELGDEGGTQLRFVADQLNRWAAGRFNLEGLPAWELPEEE
jgi:hypothetical protein